MKIRFDAEARVELDEAALWYEARRPQLGVRFLALVESSLRWLSAAPEAGTLWTARPEVRTWPVARFPFLIVYAREQDGILVLAVAHTKRAPGYWMRRRT